jgi:hypothetical protein
MKLTHPDENVLKFATLYQGLVAKPLEEVSWSVYLFGPFACGKGTHESCLNMAIISEGLADVWEL